MSRFQEKISAITNAQGSSALGHYGTTSAYGRLATKGGSVLLFNLLLEPGFVETPAGSTPGALLVFRFFQLGKNDPEAFTPTLHRRSDGKFGYRLDKIKIPLCAGQSRNDIIDLLETVVPQVVTWLIALCSKLGATPVKAEFIEQLARLYLPDEKAPEQPKFMSVFELEPNDFTVFSKTEQGVDSAPPPKKPSHLSLAWDAEEDYEEEDESEDGDDDPNDEDGEDDESSDDEG